MRRISSKRHRPWHDTKPLLHVYYTVVMCLHVRIAQLPRPRMKCRYATSSESFNVSHFCRIGLVTMNWRPMICLVELYFVIVCTISMYRCANITKFALSVAVDMIFPKFQKRTQIWIIYRHAWYILILHPIGAMLCIVICRNRLTMLTFPGLLN